MAKIPVTIYSTPNCIKCQMTKKQMDKLGIHYTEVSLLDVPEKLEEFKEQGHLTAPIVTTDTKIWSDFRLSKIQSLARHIKSMGEN